MSFIKQFISEQIAVDPAFQEAYKKAKLEVQMDLELPELHNSTDSQKDKE